MEKNIPAVSPESVGIPSQAVTDMIEELEKNHVSMHSLMLARHNKLVTSAFWRPFGPGQLHRLFSVSKSFVSIAVGWLEEDGLIRLDDPIAQYFPEYLPENADQWLKAMTIRDMLAMQTCHTATTYKIHPDQNWVESFFVTPPSHCPGTTFNYDTSSPHTLGALVEKLTRMPVLDYLRSKFLDEIGFSPRAYMICDPFGTSMGGSGLMAEPLDLMKFALAVLNKGRAEDGQILIPEKYLNQACSCQSSTQHVRSTIDEGQGYGYQFWMTRHNGFCCNGMGGQFAIFLPKEDIVCVTTADTQEVNAGNQTIFNAFFDHILPALKEMPLAEDKKARDQLEKKIHSLVIRPVNGKLRTDCDGFLGKTVYRVTENSKAFQKFFFEFSDSFREGSFHFYRDSSWHVLHFGLGEVREDVFPIYDDRCVTSAAWTSEDSLYLRCSLIGESVGTIHLQFTYKNGWMYLAMRKKEETMFQEFSGYLSAVAEVKRNAS